MTTQAFDPAAFKAQFAEFAAVPDATLTAYWEMASQYISPNDGVMLSGSALLFAVQLMTAHLARTFVMISNGGGDPGVVTGATEGGVSVSMQPPPTKNGWQFWLASTPYGRQLWALLEVQSAGGFHIGGSLERQGFRKAGGVF